jgi:hypothetical protein
MATPLVLDFIVKTGIPAGLGVVVVMYLLKVIIPEQQRLFRETIKSEQDTHKAIMDRITSVIENEGAQTRSTLASLDTTIRNHTEAVYKMYGHSMTVYENGVGSIEKPEKRR